MKGYQRGHFGCLIEMVLVAFAVVIAFPVFTSAFKHSIHHGSPFLGALAIATGWTIAALLIVFVVIPLTLAMPFICFAKLTGRRTESFREILLDYWGVALGVIIIGIMFAGLCLCLWEVVIQPLIHHFHH